MPLEEKQELLKRIPPITELLKSPEAAAWLNTHPAGLVTDCLRSAAACVRQRVVADGTGQCGPKHLTPAAVLAHAAELLL